MYKNFAGKAWGCNTKILFRMYTAIVRPIITYALVAWSKRTKLATARNLPNVQILACVCITEAMSTRPIAAIEAVLNLASLHNIVKRITFRMIKEGTTMYRSQSSDQTWHMSRGHMSKNSAL